MRRLERRGSELKSAFEIVSGLLPGSHDRKCGFASFSAGSQWWPADGSPRSTSLAAGGKTGRDRDFAEQQVQSFIDRMRLGPVLRGDRQKLLKRLRID